VNIVKVALGSILKLIQV